MRMHDQHDRWSAGDAYEPYVGRWSRLVAHDFLSWLALPPGLDWLDVGCGTGALTASILDRAQPRTVKSVDLSPDFTAYARAQLGDRRVSFDVADARRLPLETATVDAAVSGLALNFIPEPERAAGEMLRVARPGGVVAAYVWDYEDKMEFMRLFWDAAAALDPAAAVLDEGVRFPLCRPEPLAHLLQTAGLERVAVRPIDIPTHFRNFDDYWTPFLGAQGPAPGYAMSLDQPRRAALRERIRAILPVNANGTIDLVARAWAARGYRP